MQQNSEKRIPILNLSAEGKGPEFFLGLLEKVPLEQTKQLRREMQHLVISLFAESMGPEELRPEERADGAKMAWISRYSPHFDEALNHPDVQDLILQRKHKEAAELIQTLLNKKVLHGN